MSTAPPPWPPGTQPPPEPWSWAHAADTLVASIMGANLGGWAGALVEDIAPRVLGVSYAFAFRVRAAAGEMLANVVDEVVSRADPFLARIAARGLSDFFGVPVSPGEVRHQGVAGAGAGMTARLSTLVMDAMFHAFDASSTVTPERGKANAERIIDFSLGTALEGWLEGNLGAGMLSDWLPNYSDLDELISNNLGLGRAARRALGPLYNAWIVEPFRQYLARLWRDALPSEALAVRMLFRGAIDETDYFEIMSRHGWTRERAADLKVTLGKELSESNLKALLDQGAIEADTAREHLQAQGYSPAMAGSVLQVWREDRLRTYRGNLATLARDMYRDRDINPATFAEMARTAGLSEMEADALLGTAEVERSRPQALPRAVIEEAYKKGLADAVELRVHYEHDGFSERSIDILLALAVLDRERYEAAAGARLPPPAAGAGKRLPQGTWQELHRRGLITDDRLAAQLADLGIGAEPVRLLILQAQQRRQEYVAALARHELPKPGIRAGTKRIEQAFVLGLVEEAQLVAFYVSEGVDPADIGLLVELARLELAAHNARATSAGERAAAGLPRDPAAT